MVVRIEGCVVSPYATLVFTLLSNVIGQILIKKGMLTADKLQSSEIKKTVFYLIKTMVINPYILAGLILAVISTMCWMFTVSKLPLGFSYSFVSLAFPLVMILSVVLYHESVSLTSWIGMIVLMIGVILIAKG